MHTAILDCISHGYQFVNDNKICTSSYGAKCSLTLNITKIIILG